jgi:hypothetical protein
MVKNRHGSAITQPNSGETWMDGWMDGWMDVCMDGWMIMMMTTNKLPKRLVFWGIMLCGFVSTQVSEELAASIFRVGQKD